jgi:hypothetical protein
VAEVVDLVECRVHQPKRLHPGDWVGGIEALSRIGRASGAANWSGQIGCSGSGQHGRSERTTALLGAAQMIGQKIGQRGRRITKPRFMSTIWTPYKIGQNGDTNRKSDIGQKFGQTTGYIYSFFISFNQIWEP